jgi:hypothetical protein
MTYLAMLLTLLLPPAAVPAPAPVQVGAIKLGDSEGGGKVEVDPRLEVSTTGWVRYWVCVQWVVCVASECSC